LRVRDEVTGERRKLHNEKLRIFYYSPDITGVTKQRRWAGHIAQMGKVKNVCKILVGKPEGRRPLKRLRRRWEGNIKVDIKEIEFGLWIGFIWLRI
jgi:hypothetical protein